MSGLAPVVVGHRGAAGYRPEHTAASYTLAVELGADFIEPDLVMTRDGVLVARHENEIGGTTDIADHPELAGRRTTKVVDGRRVQGWFTEDLTLAELKTLRARESMPQVRPANTWYDGQLEVLTFDEVLTLAEQAGRRRGVTVGVCAELKHPGYFAALGLPVERPLVDTLRRHHLDRPNAPMFVESFEPGLLRRLAASVSVPLLQLVDAVGSPPDSGGAPDTRRRRGPSYADLLAPGGLREVATYASAIGVHKRLVLETGRGGSGGAGLVADAHDQELQVHVWTVRDENRFLSPRFRSGGDPHARGDSVAEGVALLEAGVDGLITDQADRAVESRRRWRDRQPATTRPVVAEPTLL